MTKIVLAMTGIFVIGTAVSLAALNYEKEGEELDDAQAVVLEKLPAAAREALSKLAGTAKIGEITMEDEDGVKVFEGTWKVNDVDHEASVTEHGAVVETEQTVKLASTPQAVQDAAKAAFPKGTSVMVEKKTIVVYEVEAKVNGKEKEVHVSPTGQRVEIEYGDENHEDAD